MICELCAKKQLAWPSIFFGCYQNSRIATFFISFSYFFHKTFGSFQLINKFIFPSEFTKNYYCKHENLFKNKSVVIPTYINVDKDDKALSIEENDFFLFAGQITEEKGILPLLEVFSKLPHKKLIVIGMGPLEEHIRKKYSSYHNIILKGFLPRKWVLEYMRTANATIIPSLWFDVLPNIALEALSQNCPIITSRLLYSTIVKARPNSKQLLTQYTSTKKLVGYLNTITVRDRYRPLDKHDQSHEEGYDNLIKVYSALIK